MGKIVKKEFKGARAYRADKFIETELCARFQKGDLSAFTELASAYSRLVDTVAAKYDGRQLPKSELVLYAKIGLLKAAHRYDESKMVSFRLYAIWWMRQVILKALHEQARIEQIPEMLIQNMQEIIESFRQNKTILNHDLERIEVAETIEEEITEMEKSRIRRNNGRNS